jgi:hypothetical protein
MDQVDAPNVHQDSTKMKSVRVRVNIVSRASIQLLDQVDAPNVQTAGYTKLCLDVQNVLLEQKSQTTHQWLTEHVKPLIAMTDMVLIIILVHAYNVLKAPFPIQYPFPIQHEIPRSVCNAHMQCINMKRDRTTVRHVPQDMEIMANTTILVVRRVRDNTQVSLSTLFHLDVFQEKEQGARTVKTESIRMRSESQVVNNVRRAKRAHIGFLVVARSPVIVGCTWASRAHVLIVKLDNIQLLFITARTQQSRFRVVRIVLLVEGRRTKPPPIWIAVPVPLENIHREMARVVRIVLLVEGRRTKLYRWQIAVPVPLENIQEMVRVVRIVLLVEGRRTKLYRWQIAVPVSLENIHR